MGCRKCNACHSGARVTLQGSKVDIDHPWQGFQENLPTFLQLPHFPERGGQTRKWTMCGKVLVCLLFLMLFASSAR